MINNKKYIDYKVYNITKIKDKYGFRVVLFYLDETNKTIQKAGFKTKKEANESRNKIIGELHNGTFIIEEKMTVAKFFTYWLEEEMKPRVAYSTYYNFNNIIQKYVIPKIGKVKMIELNRAHIQKLYNEVSSQYKSTAKVCKSIINLAMKYALRKQIISYNIALNINLPQDVKTQPYRTRTIDVTKTLTEEQVKILIEGSAESSVHIYILFATMLGLRISEIRGLKYSDIDYVKRTIKIQRQLGYKPNTPSEEIPKGKLTKQEIKPKTFSSYRELEIPDLLFESILEERKLYEKNRSRRINDKTYPFIDKDYICSSTYGNPRSKDFHYQEFKRLLNELHLPNIRFHDLRSTYCTILVKNEFNTKAISKMMGHASEIISIDVYTDTSAIITEYEENIKNFIDNVTPNQGGDINEKTDFTNDLDLLSAIEFINKEMENKNLEQ